MKKKKTLIKKGIRENKRKFEKVVEWKDMRTFWLIIILFFISSSFFIFSYLEIYFLRFALGTISAINLLFFLVWLASERKHRYVYWREMK